MYGACNSTGDRKWSIVQHETNVGRLVKSASLVDKSVVIFAMTNTYICNTIQTGKTIHNETYKQCITVGFPEGKFNLSERDQPAGASIAGSDWSWTPSTGPVQNLLSLSLSGRLAQALYRMTIVDLTPSPPPLSFSYPPRLAREWLLRTFIPRHLIRSR